MLSAAQLVSEISPSISLGGRKLLIFAIERTCELLAIYPPDDILFTKDVYPAVAKKVKHSVDSTERAIYRAVIICWRDGKNQYLNQVIGRVLPTKPKPSEVILYCAYYLAYEKPYHNVVGRQASPLLF